jgi:hypothetical protein
MKTVAEITNNMAYAIGTEGYTRHFTGLIFTDGVKQLRQDADAFWLVDAIASYQHKLKKVEFQVWELQVNLETKKAVLTMSIDSDKPYLVTQKIPYTDFPLKTVKFHVRLGSLDGYNPAWVLMLPSED